MVVTYLTPLLISIVMARMFSVLFKCKLLKLSLKTVCHLTEKSSVSWKILCAIFPLESTIPENTGILSAILNVYSTTKINLQQIKSHSESSN